MIRSFRDKETQKVFTRTHSRKLPPTIQQTAYRKLRMINNSMSLNGLRIPPANRLEKLSYILITHTLSFTALIIAVALRFDVRRPPSMIRNLEERKRVRNSA